MTFHSFPRSEMTSNDLKQPFYYSLFSHTHTRLEPSLMAFRDNRMKTCKVS